MFYMQGSLVVIYSIAGSLGCSIAFQQQSANKTM